MKIGLIGYGKMGKTIEGIAQERGHEIVLRTSIENTEDNTISNIGKADVIIEFTGPDSAFENLKLCVDAGVPVVCGSTGWLNHFEEIKKYCRERNGAILYASNFSIGVNIFFEINKHLAELMSRYPAYGVSISEIHHTQKRDAPSGTAITLAEQVMQKIAWKKEWKNYPTQENGELEILSERIDPAPGTHKIRYHSSVDDIEIIHTAHNRNGFAAGAVLAAEFIRGKQGIFGIEDVLGLSGKV